MKKTRTQKQHSMLTEILAAALILLAAAAVRYFYIRYFQTAPDEEGSFLLLAYIRRSAAPVYLSQTVSGLYVKLLRTVFWFAGNKPMAGVWLQAALQTGALFLLYLAFRRACGMLSGALITLLLGCLGGLLEECVKLTPGSLLFFLVCVYLWLLSGLFADAAGEDRRRAGVMALAFLAGGYLGFLISADSAGLFAAAVTIPALFLAKRPEKARGCLPFLILLPAGALLGTAGSFAAKALYYGHMQTAPYREYANNYFTADSWNFLLRFGAGSMAASGAAFLFSVLAFLRTLFRNHAEENADEGEVLSVRELTVLELDSASPPEAAAKVASAPKRREMKKMDYAFEPEEALMKYDLDDSEGDGGLKAK